MLTTIGSIPEIIAFLALIVFVLVIDFFALSHSHGEKDFSKRAAIWCIIWVSLAASFAGLIFWRDGTKPAMEFSLGYLIELALSIDNLFVFILIFKFFGVPDAYRKRVLFYGIAGAVILRAVFIALGTSLLMHFEILIQIFGAILVWSAFKLAKGNNIAYEPTANPVYKLAKRIFRCSENYDGELFFTRINGVRYVTPLFLVLITIETADVVFAIDSIPAIFGVTRDPYIVFTSNIFAVLGLRSFFLLLERALGALPHLSTGLAIVLGFIGVKMLLEPIVEVPIELSVAIVIGVLVITSLLPGKKKHGQDLV